MKKIFLLLFVILVCNKIFSQVDYSGTYSFKSKVEFDKKDEVKPNKMEAEQGRSGTLTLLKIDEGKYKIWLSGSKGWPSYNIGEVNGIITIKNNKAVYSEAPDYSDAFCKIAFTFYANYIKVEQQSLDTDCGFGMGVYTDGDYVKKNSIKMNYAALQKMYSGYSRYSVIPEKAFLYESRSASKLKKQYFIKGDKLIAVKENDDLIYVEFITNSGKFIYGWLKKFDVKAIK